jgi:glycogen operon protein
MSDDDWSTGHVRCIGVRMAGDLIDDENERGEPIAGDTILLLFNAHHEELPFTLPSTRPDHLWERLIDTSDDDGAGVEFRGNNAYPLKDRSLAILRTKEIEEKEI